MTNYKSYSSPSVVDTFLKQKPPLATSESVVGGLQSSLSSSSPSLSPEYGADIVITMQRQNTTKVGMRCICEARKVKGGKLLKSN